MWRFARFVASDALDADEDRNHHRGLVRASEQVSSHGVTQGILYEVEVHRVHTLSGILHRLLDKETSLVQHVLVFAQVDESTTDDVWTLAELTSL